MILIAPILIFGLYAAVFEYIGNKILDFLGY